MKGGFNKILRNIVAGAADSEFEKVSIYNCANHSAFLCDRD